MKGKRSAEETIKGFGYQFAATIGVILDAADDATIGVEGIEDVDVWDTGLVSAIQCKYYERTKLTNSILRDIVKPMLEDFREREKRKESGIHYYVYGCFKECAAFPLDDAESFQSQVLRYEPGKDNDYVAGNIAVDLGLSPEMLSVFLTRLHFRFTDTYDMHLETIYKKLQHAFSCTRDEVVTFYYPVAFTTVNQIAIRPSEQARRVTKREFVKQFASKQLLFKFWLLHERGQEAFCRAMRKQYFSSNNVGSHTRIFIIDCKFDEQVSTLADLLLHLGDNWSSAHKTARLGVTRRYAPYIFFRNVAPASIRSALAQLHLSGRRFVDGFPYFGASFTLQHISQAQLPHNEISFRLLHTTNELEQILAAFSNELNQIFEFYQREPLAPCAPWHHIQIPLNNASIVRDII